MNSPSKLKEKMVAELQAEVDLLKTQLENANRELKELKETPDSVIDRLKIKFKSEEPEPAEPKAKRKQTRTRLTPEASQALKDGLIEILKKHGDWMQATDVKAAFIRLPNAGTRYNAIISQSQKDKVIVSRGELRKTEYKLK